MGEYAEMALEREFRRYGFSEEVKYTTRQIGNKGNNMANQKTVYLRGKIAWAHHLFEADEFPAGQKNWKVTVYPDSDEIKKMKAEGIQARMKFDEGEKSGIEGKCFTFRRPTEKEFKKGITKFDAPRVTHNGVPLDKDTQIGNGSIADIELEVYATKNFGNGTRLVSVNIIDLIVYEGDEESSKPENKEEIPF